MRKIAKIILLLILSRDCFASSECQIGAAHLYCQSPSSFVAMSPQFNYMYGTHGSGADERSMSILYSYGCSITNSTLKVTTTEKRNFNTVYGPVSLIHVRFNESRMIHEENAFSKDGEYLGKRKISFTGGWFGKMAIQCGEK
jgi:hypothetical protein